MTNLMNGGLTRRTMLGGMAASAMPVAALAAPEPEALTDAEHVQACADQLKALLAKMHPVCNEVHFYFKTEEDGTFRLNLQGTREYLPFTGDGLYQVSQSGYVETLWVMREPLRRKSDGSVIEGMDNYRTWPVEGSDHGEERVFGSVNIVRKLDGAFKKPANYTPLPAGNPWSAKI